MNIITMEEKVLNLIRSCDYKTAVSLFTFYIHYIINEYRYEYSRESTDFMNGYFDIFKASMEEIERNKPLPIDKDGNTVLHYSTGNPNGIELFLEKVSSDQLSIKNNDGNTPLHMGLKKWNNVLSKLLIERLTDEQLLIRNKEGNIPLHYTTDIQIAKLLLKKSPETQLSVQNDEGNTPLHNIINHYHHRIVFVNRLGELLIEHSTSEQLVIPNNKGDTPLHIAMRNGCIFLIKLILSKIEREDKFIKNNEGNTPLDLTENEDIIALFQPIVKKA